MNVRELIAELEKIENKDAEVYILAKVWDSHFGEEIVDGNSIENIYLEEDYITIEGSR